jgi:hypothetical protein
MTQSAHCRLNQVLLVFGLLYREYTDMIFNTDAHTEPLHAILDSIEKRWAKCDQDVFIAALILNPVILPLLRNT